MSIYTIVDTTGEQLRVININSDNSDEEMLGNNVKAGERAIQGVAPSATHWWNGGNSTGTWVARPESPSEYHIWNGTLKEWQDPRPLSEIKASKWESIKAAREAEENEVFEWNGSWFDADAQRLNGIVMNALVAGLTGRAFTVNWTLADNTFRTLTGPEIIEVGNTLTQKIDAAHQKSRLLRLQLDAATTVEQVEAVVW